MSDILYSGVVDGSGIPQLDAQGFLLDPSNPASGLVGTFINGLPVWSAMQTAQHLLRTGANWADIHPNLAISYSFGDPTVWTAGSGFLAFDARGQQAAQLAMQLYADVSTVTFYQSADVNAADITFRYIEGGQNGGGWAMYPWPGGVTVNVNNVSWEPVVTAGTYSLNLQLHELGHAMGLDHPGDYNGDTAVYTDADHFNDSDQYTNMSYWGESYTGGNIAASVATLGLHDILAIQMAYGINWATRATDTVYGYHATAGLDSYDFTHNQNMGFSIWDGGGIDTLDFSGFVAATVLDLRQGSFSSTANGTYNVSIAYGATIENAVGGSANDKIHGNEVANLLQGGSGNDTIYGGADDPVSVVANPGDFLGIRLNSNPKVSNQYLDIAHLSNTPTTAFTLEMLVNFDRLGAGAALASLSPGYGLEFEVVNGIVQATVNGAVFSTGYAIEQIIDGNSHRLSLAWNGSNGAIYFYVDGILMGSGGVAAGTTLAGNGRFVIGQDQNYYGTGFSSGREFDGTIGDIRLFNVMRSSAKIADNAFSDLTSSEPGLVHNWKVTAGTTTTVTDIVAGGQALAIVNGGTVHSTATVISSAPDNDVLVGGGGVDSLYGGAGNDRLYGDDMNGHVDAGVIDLVHINKTYAGSGWSDAVLQRAAFSMPTSAVTFEMVLKLDSPPVYATRIISYGDNSWDGYGTQDFTLRADLYNSKYELVIGGQSFDTGLSLATTFLGADATRLSISWDRASGAVAVYLDGLLVKSGTVGAGAVLPATAALDIVDGSFQILKGAIGDIRVWDHVRTASEIAQDAWIAYTSSVGKTGLVADWQANAGSPASLANIVSGSPIGGLSINGTSVSNPALFETTDFAARFRDTLDGGVGDDILRGGQGNDTLAGGAGNDTADWSDTSTSVAMTLAEGGNGTFTSEATGVDTYTSIENVILGSGDDSLTGNSGDNVLTGGGGDDFVDGAAGIDTAEFDGLRSDYDITYDPTTHQFTVTDLRPGAPSGTDTVANIEYLKFADSTILAKQISNQAPTTQVPIANQAATEDTAFTLVLPAGTFADADPEDTLTLTATLDTGAPLPAWLTFNAATRTFSGTPGNGDVGALHVKVVAADDIGAAVEETFDIIVANSNDAPILVTPLPDYNGVQGVPLTFTLPAGAFTEIDAGDAFTLSAKLADGSALPTWLSFDAATRTFSGTPTNNEVGITTVTVTAADNAGAMVSDTFTLTVDNVNDAPLPLLPLSILPSASENVAYLLKMPSASFIDIDAGDTLTYSATLANGSALPAWLSFDPDTQTFSGTPSSADSGILQIKFIATDTAGATAYHLLTLAVNDINDVPVVAAPIIDQGASEDQAFSFTLPSGTFTDADVGDTLTLTATKADGSPLPTWLSFDAATRTFSGTPTNADVGPLSIKVTATDLAGTSASDIFDLPVANTNDAPLAATPISFLAPANEDTAYSFTFSASTFIDLDAGDTLTYSMTKADGSALPSWLSFDAATRTLSGTPANGDVGTLNLKVIATDTAGASAFQIVTLPVINTNDAPTIGVPTSMLAPATEDAAFNSVLPAGMFIDVDAGDTLTYSVTRADGSALPAWLSFDAATRTFTGTPANSDVGTLSLKVTATDAAGASAFQFVTLPVVNTNDAPLAATPIPFLAPASEDAAYAFTFSASTFIDLDAGDTLTYSVTKADGSALPAWLSFDAATRTLSGTPVNGDVGTLSLKVIATDTAGASAFQFVTLPVINTNDAPTIGVPTSMLAPATEDAAFNSALPAGMFIDLDAGDTLTYSVTKADGSALPAWLSFDVATRMFTGTPANNDVGTLSLKVIATDAAGASAFQIVTLPVVNTNDAPLAATPIPFLAPANEDAAYSFTFSASTFIDVDAGDTLTYSVTKADGSALPAWLSFDAATRTLSGTPANGDVATLNLKVIATDTAGASAFQFVTLPVINANDAPTSTVPVADQHILKDLPFALTLAASTFTDVDAGDALTITAASADGSPLPAWLTFDAATRTLSGTPSESDVGTYHVKLTATDGSGASAIDTFDISVAASNTAPVVAVPIADQAASEDVSFAFVVPTNALVDGDAGDILTFTATRADGSALPAWLSFDAATRTFTGTPANGDVGTLSLQVTATDATGAAVSDVFDVSISNTNDAPLLISPMPPAPSANEDSPFNLTLPTGMFIDVDAGDTLTYSVTRADGSALPSWLSFDAATRTLSGTPANGDVGTLNLKVIATDTAGASAFQIVTLPVINTNDAPTIGVPTSMLAPATEDAAFNSVLPAGMFIDVDAGDTLTYSVTRADGSALPAWLSFDAATRTFTGTPANSDVGTLSLKVTATDAAGASAFQFVTLPVANTNDAPLLAAPLADQAASSGTAFSLTLPAGSFSDVDLGDALTLSATRADGTALPGWLTFDASSRTFSGTPSDADAGSVTVKITATDTAGSSASDDFVVVVAAPAVVAPSVAGTVSIGNASVIEGDSGTTSLVFTVTRTGGTTAFDVGYASSDGVAMVQDNDYVATSGTVHFADGQTTATIAVTINGDALNEGDQSLYVSLQNATGGAAIGNAVGVGTIVNDDTAPASNTVTISQAGKTTHTGTADDMIVGSTGIDTLYGDGGDDTVFAGAGQDSVYGGDGADTLVGNANIFGKEHDLLDGGNGDDTIYGEYTDTIAGGAGYDILYAVNAYDWAIDIGASSIELMIADFGNDTIDASTQTAGVEVVASGGNDLVHGSNFGDRLWGGTGNDTLNGNGGDDMLFGDYGADKLSGGAGNDVLYVDDADTVVDGGTGSDVVYVTSGAGMMIDMGAQGVEFIIDLAGGNNVITAATATVRVDVFTGAGGDTITGSGFDDILWGMGGADVIAGGAGDDVLLGGTGADILTPGAGVDRIYLGTGSGGDGAADRIVLAAGWGNDTVFDFEHGVDKIDLTALHTSFAAIGLTTLPTGAAVITVGSETLIVAGAAGTLDQNDLQF